VLALFPRHMGESNIDSSVQELKQVMLDTLGITTQVVDSLEWFRTQFPRHNDWDAWVWETVTGKSYATRKPHFDAYVVVGSRLGKASAGIVNLALRNQKPVFCLTDSRIAAVSAITSLDADDMASGWAVSEQQEIT